MQDINDAIKGNKEFYDGINGDNRKAYDARLKYWQDYNGGVLNRDEILFRMAYWGKALGKSRQDRIYDEHLIDIGYYSGYLMEHYDEFKAMSFAEKLSASRERYEDIRLSLDEQLFQLAYD